MSRCSEVEIAHNTILFSWSRTKDFKDMGYGVRIMTKASYNIHHNLIGTSVEERTTQSQQPLSVHESAQACFAPAEYDQSGRQRQPCNILAAQEAASGRTVLIDTRQYES